MVIELLLVVTTQCWMMSACRRALFAARLWTFSMLLPHTVQMHIRQMECMAVRTCTSF